MTNPGDPSQRLFFALWPCPQARQALELAVAQAVQDSGGRPVPAEKWHVTLAFLGSVPEGRVGELRRIGRECAAAFAHSAPVSLTFAQLEHWARPQILAALTTGESPAVHALAQALKDASVAGRFSPDLKPFRAHVTVARKIARPPPLQLLRLVTWQLEAFALIDSRSETAGPVYSVVETYPLVKTQKVRE